MASALSSDFKKRDRKRTQKGWLHHLISFSRIIEEIENGLNGLLMERSSEAFETSPFRLYADIGDAEKARRELNDVISPRFGIVSLVTSEVAPLGGLEIYNYSASVDILVNVDKMEYEGLIGEYAPVKETREIIDSLAAELSAVPFNLISPDGVTYSVLPVYNLASSGIFSIQPSELGKVVPLSFTARVSVVEAGVNSADIKIKFDGVEIPVSQINIDMICSSEGQTREGRATSTFNIQEARYSLAFVTPLTTSNFCQKAVAFMHQGEVSGAVRVYQVRVVYPSALGAWSKMMYFSSVRLTAQIPSNAGLNIEMIEADELPQEE